MEPGHKISLGGSYPGDPSDMFKEIERAGILQFVNVGREFTLQVKSEEYEHVVLSLRRLGVDNISILEWKKHGTTLASSGASPDDDNLLNVSLIPSALGTGMRSLTISHKLRPQGRVYDKISQSLEKVLQEAGVTDALYAVEIGKDAKTQAYVDAVRQATLNALFNCGGVVSTE